MRKSKPFHSHIIKFSKLLIVRQYTRLLLLSIIFTGLHFVAEGQTDRSDFKKNFCLIKTNSKTFKEANTIAQKINERGGQVAVISSPEFFVGWISKANYPLMKKIDGIDELYDQEVSFEMNEKDKSFVIVEYFNSVVSGDLFNRDPIQSEQMFQKYNDALPSKKVSQNNVMANLKDKGLSNTATLGNPCGITANSEYMVGTIACALFFLESDGTIDNNTYTWSLTDYNSIHSQAIDSWSVWSYTASSYSVSVTCILQVYGHGNSVYNQPYEPILRPSTDDSLWIKAIMGNLSYTSGSYFDRVHAYNTWLKGSAGANHAFSAFIAYNPGNAPINFSNNMIPGYAYIGGPYTQLAFRIGGWLSTQFYRVYAHETGHIFHAFDEYSASPAINCTYSFNGIINSNYHGSTCNGTALCLMLDVSFSGTGASRQWNMCNYTPSHIGWQNLTPAPTITTPANGSTLTVNNTVNFQWNRNTTNTNINSYLQVINTSTSQVVFCNNMYTTSSTSMNLPNGNYAWTVINGKDNYTCGYAMVPGNTGTFTVAAVQYNISLIANPLNGGTCTGGGLYYNNAIAIVNASSNPGWGFISWTDQIGNIVSTTQTYNHVVIQNEILTANFIDITSIGENDELIKVAISPNPSIDGRFNIELDNVPTGGLKIGVLNVLGKRVYFEDDLIVKGGKQSKIIELDVGQGVYLLIVQTLDHQNRTYKLVVR